MKRRMDNQSLMRTKCKVNGIGEHYTMHFFAECFSYFSKTCINTV